MVAELNGDGSF